MLDILWTLHRYHICDCGVIHVPQLRLLVIGAAEHGKHRSLAGAVVVLFTSLVNHFSSNSSEG